MQKIEELTLYLIEANKTIEQQNQRLAALEKEIITNHHFTAANLAATCSKLKTL
jgi:uncharacterized coiled-coil protein SlyX